MERNEPAMEPIATSLRKHMNERGIGDLNRKHGPFKRRTSEHNNWWEYATESNLHPDELADQADAYQAAFLAHANEPLRGRVREVYLRKVKNLDQDDQSDRTLSAIRTLAYKTVLGTEASAEIRSKVESEINKQLLGSF